VIKGTKNVGQISQMRRKLDPSKCFKCWWWWYCKNLASCALTAKTRLITFPGIANKLQKGREGLIFASLFLLTAA